MKVRAAFALLLSAASAGAQQYRFPIELPASGPQPYVTAYRDHDATSALQDWNCGDKTYGGHQGTDFGIGSWPVMDSGSRWIVAAAPGQVAYINDGCFDHCTTADCDCGGGFGNYVKVTHADGKATLYGHMMTGSIVVGVGESVSCGQHLGKVGSSGFSTGPHLHFEPRYANGASDDPFSGPCGGPISFWVSQGAYQALPSDQCETATQVDVDDAEFVSETIPAGSVFAPSESFDKSWTIKNTGTTTWTKPSFALAHDSGDSLGAPAAIDLSDAESIAPGSQKTFTIKLNAPAMPGTYAGDFRMDHVGVSHFGATLHVEIAVSKIAAGGGGSGGGSGTDGGEFDAGDNEGGATSLPAGGAPGSQRSAPVADGDGGCGCRIGPSPSTSGFAASIALALSAFARCRKRRRMTRSS